MPRLVALFRKSTYSPNQHRANDRAILEDTLAHLQADRWEIIRRGEDAVERDVLPAADLYLNMCQGEVANQRLLALEASGAVLINRPSAVLGCHRNRLVATLAGRGLPFPATEIHDLQGDGALDAIAASPLLGIGDAAGQTVWIKRGDVHAERTEDVVAASADAVRATAAAFAERGIARIALQAHVPGPVLKFYALANRRFFRYYDAAAGPTGPRPRIDEARLRTLVFDAAALLGLDVFGGDVAVPAEDNPILIDLNDWPSFAPYRADAAAGIADYVRHHAARGRSSQHDIARPSPPLAADIL